MKKNYSHLSAEERAAGEMRGLMFKGLLIPVAAFAAVIVASAGILFGPLELQSFWMVVQLLSMIVGIGSVARRAIKTRRYVTSVIAAIALLCLLAALVVTLKQR